MHMQGLQLPQSSWTYDQHQYI